jgi:hypothetical protein
MTETWGTHAAMDMAASQCIDELQKCHRACADTASRCLMIGGVYAQAERLSLLLDCAQACQVSADFLLRRSSFQLQMCIFCTEVCVRAADMCAEFQDDPLMRACERACRRSAAASREMTGTVVA